ncbi:arylsulfatase A [Ameyamaea chiangmaiensis NBRC 103196]|uniref:Choline-sulfatase n=1 Tax=Ameyamaea chiangmaiensis TaxID=442969 RepID=A0A850P8S1_9PROT|nr:choline-sulfatase [Ameyamaea chiangmaiensis]MBS4076077.1 choline-sulfatase [Ameyamaea chiangmaiensis]NVN41015.1 choline-sulfatase [Ameyamaea chiangmaiensis]GBQ66927.1 arylsulfatase A [Ameyamaea chiangmaiensis NBRC 103196]
MREQPDILILMADQMKASALPAYGNTVARTPHLDALARRAVVFDNAYCNVPLCAPSRAVFMSGRLASRIGAYDNAAEFPAQTPTFAHHLRLAGYETILTGKMHFCGPDQLHGFETRLTTDIYPADFNWTPDWTRFDERLEWYHTMNSVTEAGKCVRTNQLDFDEEVTFSARQKLFDLARDPDRRPFAMVVSLTHPHDPFTIPDPWWSRYTDAEIDMPRVAAPPPQDRDPHMARLRHINGMDLQNTSEAQVRAARHAYYGACSFVDDCFGHILATLRDTGMDRNTIVIVIADHGEMLGERGQWYKMSFFDDACRIPLMICAPERFAPRRVGASVSLVDLLPTLCDLAGQRDTLPGDGRSLLPYCMGQDDEGLALGEYTAEGAVAPIVMIRRGRWKFVHCPTDPDQLYDLQADPLELVNLAPDPGHARLCEAFATEVASRWNLRELHDDVLASQRRRRLVADAMRKGVPPTWDHQPRRDAGSLYVRSHMDLEVLERRARFPAPGQPVSELGDSP